MTVHTIPVPHGWSAEQAWEAIQRGEKLPTPTAYWVNMHDGKVITLSDPFSLDAIEEAAADLIRSTYILGQMLALADRASQAFEDGDFKTASAALRQYRALRTEYRDPPL